MGGAHGAMRTVATPFDGHDAEQMALMVTHFATAE
jgi:hypothetical protein